MKSLSIILYHGCGRCYLDGTNALIADNEGCKMPTNNPFWKSQKILITEFQNQQEVY